MASRGFQEQKSGPWANWASRSSVGPPNGTIGRPRHFSIAFGVSAMMLSTRLAGSLRSVRRHVSNVAAFEDVKLPQKTNFVEVPAAKGLMPEGLAGDMEDEFAMTRKRSWMIRDVSRVMCAILDDFPVKNGKARSDKVIPALPSASDPAGWNDLWHSKAFPGYSDRPEWRGSLTSVQLYGAELMPGPKADLGKLKNDVADDAALRSWNRVAPAPVPATELFRNGLKAAVQKLSKGPYKLPKAYPEKVMLCGERGVGKSAVLNQLVLHARSSGWLTLFVPNGWDHVQSGWFIEPVAGGLLYDNVFMSANLLRNFYDAHTSQLQDVPLAFPEKLEKYAAHLANFQNEWDRARQIKGRDSLAFREMRQIILKEDHFAEQDALDAHILNDFDFTSFKPKTLRDLVILGIAFRDLAGSVVVDVVDELKVVESFPVLIAVDQYNAWDAGSAFHWESKHVHGKEICVPSALSFISKKKGETDAWQLKNGLCVAAVSSKHPEGLKEQYKHVANSIPLTVTVPSYNQREFISAVSHYEQSSLISGGVTLSELNNFRTITGSVGREVRRETIPTFFPLAVAKGGDDFMAAAEADRTPAWQPQENNRQQRASQSRNSNSTSTSEVDDNKGILDSL